MDIKDLSVETFGGLVVLNDKNESIKLSTLWQDKPAVLVFVRHFG